MIQEQTLSKILSTGDSSIITLNSLSEDFFSDYKSEFLYIKDFMERYGKVPDTATFLGSFPNFELLQVNESDIYLLEELNKDRRKRKIAESFNKIRGAVMSGDIEEADRLIAEAYESRGSSISMNAIDLMSDVSRYDRYMEKVNDPGSHFIKTGFKELDDIMGGGWDVHEELGCIVARTGLGKSWILFKSSAAAVKQGFTVGIYSGEMSEDKVGWRIDTLISHISNGALMHGGGNVKNEYKAYIDGLAESGYGKLYVLTPAMINRAATVSDLRAFIEKYNLDVLFVDQHSLLADERKAKNPVEKAANISTDLKLLQVTKGLPIICVCQQNRSDAGEDKKFDTTQLAQSDKIGQDATMIIFIERKDEFLKLHIGKARDGGEGKVLTYQVDLNKGSFIYIPEEEKDSGSSHSNTSQSYENYNEDEVF